MLGNANHWLVQGQESQPQSQGCEDPHCGLVAASIRPGACLSLDWTSSEMDSYPEYASALLPPSMPHTGPGVTAVAATEVPTWWGRESQGRIEQPSAHSALDALPSWAGPNPRGRWPNPLPDSESRPPTRVCPQDAPAPRRRCHADQGGALLNRHLLLRCRTPCSMERSPLEAGHSRRSGARAQGWHPGCTASPETHCALVSPLAACLTSTPSLVLVFLTQLSI